MSSIKDQNDFGNERIASMAKTFKNFQLTVLPLLVVLVIGILILNPFVIINSGERGIVKTFGKVSDDVRKDGLSFKIPMVQSIDLMSIRNETISGQAVAYSSDLQTMTVHFKTIYALPETELVNLYIKYQGRPYENFVEPRIEEAVKTIAAQYTAEGFVTKRQDAKDRIIELVKKKLSGLVDITDIAIINVDLTDELERAIEKKQVEQQKAEQKKYELAAAKQDAHITVTRATAEAEAIRVKAFALKQSPQLVELEKVKMMETKWDGKLPATLVIGDKGQLILPLQKEN